MILIAKDWHESTSGIPRIRRDDPKLCFVFQCARQNSESVPDRASSEGCTIRRVGILSNKLLTTAFEASLECIAAM